MDSYFHNTVEDTVISRVNEIFVSLEKKGNPEKFCTCDQCRMDIICYVLNRMPPHYIVSNRGASRVQWESIERQQQAADVAALIHEGLMRVTHNQRPYSHSSEGSRHDSGSELPVFNIPTIMGRIFSGTNFAPLSDMDVELLRKGELVQMKDRNWQNPCRLVPNTEGSFSFWPAVMEAQSINDQRIFEYSLRVVSPEYETLNHFFKIPVTSEIRAAESFNLERTFRLPDLYMFPQGEAELDRCLD